MKIRNKTILALIFASFLLVLSACGEVQDGKYAAIAQCLTSKGVKFYGAYWCSHCAEQKKILGSDMRYINYVECDPGGQNSKRDECVAAGVQSYPSWFFPGQGLSVGVQDPVELAQKANCAVGDVAPIDNGSTTGTTQAPAPAPVSAKGAVSVVPLPVTPEAQPKQ